LAACSDDPTGSGRAIVAVSVSADVAQVETGDSLVLTAKPRQADGRTNRSVSVSWYSTDTAVAKVEGRAGQRAVVVGKAPGPVTIRAMAEDKVGQTSLTVIVTEQGVPVVTAISPQSATEGDALVELTVTGVNFTEMSLVRFNGVAIATQFVSSTELRGLIAATNLAQVGTAEVTVRTGSPGGGTSAGKPFSILPRVVTVRVTAPNATIWVGEEMELDAIPQDAQGRDLPRRATQWASVDANLAISPNGRVKATAAGVGLITATVDGRMGSTYVQAVDAPVYDLMYDSNRGSGGRELWIVSLGADATPRRWLPEGFLGEDAATNRDGTRIAFVGRDQYLNSDIWVANRDGSDLTRLTSYGGSDDQPAWSTDGSKIAFRSVRSGQAKIWIMNADGSNQRNLMEGSYNFFDGVSSRPSFANNGRIYFHISYPDSTSVLASLPVTGTWQNLKIHTPPGYSDYEPAVSWDGSTIMLRRRLRSANNAGVIVYTDLDGNQLFTLNEPGIGWTPAWSRNDQYIAYGSSPDGRYPTDIYVKRRSEFWTKRITTGLALGGGRNPVFIKR
jgi:Tol biopolymer transport system component